MTHLANIFRMKHSDTISFEKQLRQATSNKEATPSQKDLMDISDHSNNYKDLDKIMKRIWKILDSGNRRKWRKTCKALNLVDHLLKNGSFQCVEEFRDKKEKFMAFQKYYYFEGGQDRGFAIREQSDKILSLLNNRDFLSEQREEAQQLSQDIDTHRGGSKLAHSATLQPTSSVFSTISHDKENENKQNLEKPKNKNVNNPFKPIPAPPETTTSLNFSRSKSNPASIDLLGLENPTTTATVNENKNIAGSQPKETDPPVDPIQYLLEKKESSESEKEEKHSDSHSDIEIGDQQSETVGYSHLNSRHQNKRHTTQIKVHGSVEDVDDLIDTAYPENISMSQKQISPPISSHYDMSLPPHTLIHADVPKVERKTSFNNPFKSDYNANSNFNNPFRSPPNENVNPNFAADLSLRKTVSMQVPGSNKNFQQQQVQPQICSSSEDLDHLAMEFASKIPAKNNLLSGGGQSHDEEDIYMTNSALVNRASCPGNMGLQQQGFNTSYNNPFNNNNKSCRNNPFAPKLL